MYMVIFSYEIGRRNLPKRCVVLLSTDVIENMMLTQVLRRAVAAFKRAV